MAGSFEAIRAAVIEGRAQSPRYIQRQLVSLHDALVKAQSDIRRAIRRETNYTTGEVDAEIYLALKVLKQEFNAFDFPSVLEAEYSIAHLKDHPSRRVALGCAYIIPSEHNRFYSIVQPTAAAIAAGNCVMIELADTKHQVDILLRRIICESVNQATVAIVAGKPNDQDFFTQHCVVVDTRLTPETRNSARALSASSCRNVAIVDRTVSQADLALAASEIVRARFSFDGKSPYAPDLVLVNEFVLQQFCREAANFATISLVGNVPSTFEDEEADLAPREPKQGKDAFLEALQKTTGVSTLVSGTRGTILLVQQRDCSLLSRKINEPTLLIHAIRSLDDGIDLINQCNSGKTHAAAYLFANAATAKYLGQFISYGISYTNSIPVELLVGPEAPTSSAHAASIQPRYPTELFSRPSPEHISPRQEQALLTALVDSSSKDSRRQVQNAVTKALIPPKQGSGFAVGFFEQGLLIGGAISVVTIASAITALVKYAGPATLRTLKWN